ncbi:MAG TPA: hypothetical protein VH025_09680, partial [Solirubrobacteraceae bacterium]|nr:hypothetical protein [Solirubrobacteraceae bacterium]
GTMITAIRTVHLKNGPWSTDGGYEYNLVLLGAVMAITDAGPGAFSLDAAAGRSRWGAGWALAQLAAGAAGSSAVIALGRRRAAAAAASSTAAEQSGTGEAPGQSASDAGAGADGESAADQAARAA